MSEPKILGDVKLNVKWKVSTSTSRPGTNTGTDGYVNENISDTLGKVVKYLNDLDSNKLDTSTVSTSGSYGSTGWSDCKLVNGKIKYYYTGNNWVATSEDNSSKLYLTGTKSTGISTGTLYKNTSVYEQDGVIYAPEVNTDSLVLNDSRPKNLLRYKPRKYAATGVTFVANDDGSITVSGTATARTVYTLNMDKSIIPGAGTYVLSSGGVSTSSSTYWVEAYIEYDSSSYMYKQTYTNSTYVQFTLSTNTIRNVIIYIIVDSGKTCNQTFKPMLCTLDDWNKSTTFYPPAISINELYRTTQTVSSMYPGLAMYGQGTGGLNFQPVNTTWCGYIVSDSNRFPGQYAISRMYPLDETGSYRCHIIELTNGGKLTRYYNGSDSIADWSEYVLTPYVQQCVCSNVTTSTSLSDTGISVTLQEIGTYRITGTVLYVYAEPEEVALYVGNHRIAYTSGTNVTELSLTVSGFVRATSRNSLTVKLYAKTNSSSTNHVTLMAEHVSLNY